MKVSSLGVNHPDTLHCRINLANSYLTAGRVSEAMPLFESTLKLLEAGPGPNHPLTLECRNYLAVAYELLGRWDQAELLHRETLGRRRKTVKPDSPVLAGDLVLLGSNLLSQSRSSEAEPLLREALAIRERATPEDWERYEAMSLVGGSLLREGRDAEAEPLITEGYQGMKNQVNRIFVPDRHKVLEAAMRVVRLYEDWGRPDQASLWKNKLGLPDLPSDAFAAP